MPLAPEIWMHTPWTPVSPVVVQPGGRWGPRGPKPTPWKLLKALRDYLDDKVRD